MYRQTRNIHIFWIRDQTNIKGMSPNNCWNVSHIEQDIWNVSLISVSKYDNKNTKKHTKNTTILNLCPNIQGMPQKSQQDISSGRDDIMMLA